MLHYFVKCNQFVKWRWNKSKRLRMNDSELMKDGCGVPSDVINYK